MIHDEEAPTEEELREAEALATALERGRGTAETPGDALGAAALLRYNKDGGALEQGQGQAILEDALSLARPRGREVRSRHWLLGLLGLAAAGAASLAILQRAQAPGALAVLPKPSRTLLQAQIEAAGGGAASLGPLSAETANFRVAMYTALRERYGR
jgi:hypothetical protein